MAKQIHVAKVLPFVRPSRGGEALQSQRTARVATGPRRPWHRQRIFWLAWWALAWMLAASRLALATRAREVFGFQAAVAFLIAVVLPLMASPILIDMARTAFRELKHVRESHAARAGVDVRKSRGA
jgi:hypothetical protein